MEFNNVVGIEQRETGELNDAERSLRFVRARRLFHTNAKDLWRTLTSAECIPLWFLPVSGDLNVGGRFRLEGNASGEIKTCDQFKSFYVTWEFGGNISWVECVLGMQGEGVSLMLEHTMMRDKESETHWEKFGPGAVGVGWDLSFLGLALHIDSGGEALNQDAMNAWLGSNDGKTYIRNCALAWRDAHIVAGEVEDRATALAQRTADFYTGA